MATIDKVQQYIDKSKMQQQEANAALLVPKPVNTVNQAPVPALAPSLVPMSAIDSEAPVTVQAEAPQVNQVVPPIAPMSAIDAGGMPGITTESFEEAMKRGKYPPAQWLYENEKAAKEGRRGALTMEDYLRVYKYGDMDESPEQKAKRERREKVSQAISGIGNVIANAANLAFAAKGAVPMELNSGMKELDERQQRIKAKRDVLKEKQDAILLNAKMRDLQNERSLESAKAKATADRAEKIEQRAFELLKQEKTLSAQEARDKARLEFEGKHKDADRTQKAKHDLAMEGIGYANVKTAAERAKQAKQKSSKDEKFDYVIVDNKSIPIPKDESKAWFSTIYQIMKRDPNIKGDAMESIEIKYGEGGDSDSKMMNTVRRRISDSPEAVKYIQNVVGNKPPELETKQPHTPFSTQWGGLSWGNEKNNNVTDW